MPFEYAITDREKGQYPISIATSLALESITGIHEEVKHPTMPVLEFKELWINLRTLYRNLIGSIEQSAKEGVTPLPLAQAMMHEIEMLDYVVKDKSLGKCKCVYYVSNYEGLEKKYKHSRVRVARTDKQKLYVAVQDKTIELVLKALEKEGGREVYVYRDFLKPKSHPKAMILTHYAFDLLSSYSFTDLTLLESHTGKLKPKSLFYTKYHEGKLIPMIPFLEGLLPIFGDSELFQPWDIRIRREIIELAKEVNWTQITSKDRIKSTITYSKMSPQTKAALIDALG